MGPRLGADDERALRALSVRYAAGVDRRDVERFVGVFTADGCLSVHAPGRHHEPRSVLRGPEALARVIASIAAYETTFHLLGQGAYALDDDGASGEVYCTARHLSVTRHGAVEFTMHIRYQDRYRQDEQGWRIADRHVLVDWTTSATADPPAPDEANPL